MHLAYFLREGANEELRYSLRSAEENLPEIEAVWIIGGRPEWLTNVEHIGPGNPYPDKQRNVYANVRALAEHPDLPDEIVIMNDDFLTMEPAKPEPAWRCALAEHIAPLKHAWWRDSLEATEAWLHERGYEDPLSYELHRPLPVVRADMAGALQAAADVRPENPPQWRTLYGNLANIGGEQSVDSKVYNRTSEVAPSGPWLSSTDRALRTNRNLRVRLANRFRNPCRWEA